jgi:hypothetical protein
MGFTETVRLLAGIFCFVIADITNPRSATLELQATVPECMIPFVSILEKGEEPFAMPRDLHPLSISGSACRDSRQQDHKARPPKQGCPAGEKEGGKVRRRGRLAAVRSLQE